MSAQQDNNLNELFYLTLDWYSKRPNQPIPLDMWDAMADRFGHGYEKVIRIGNRQIADVATNLIPVLAAINAGVSSQALMETIKYHQVDAHIFLNARFAKLLQGKEQNIPGTNKAFILDNFSVIKEIVNASCLDDELSKQLASVFPDYEDSYGPDACFEIAGLLSTNKYLWPITYLEKYLNDIELGVEARRPILTPAGFFQDADIDFGSFTKDQIMLILEHSGNLHSGVICENGFSDQYVLPFFNSIFSEIHTGYSKGLSGIINAINTIEDPSLVSRVSSAIIRSVSDFEIQNESMGPTILKNMETFLNRKLYQEVINSISVKLNVLLIEDLPSILSERIYYSQHSALNEFNDDGDKIFKRLHDELSHFKASEFRRPHFRALGSLLDDWKVPQDLSGIDLHGFLIKTLDALESYRQAKHRNDQGKPTDELAVFASRQVERLSQFVAQNQSQDYKRLANLPSASKALLAANGFDVRKLPGINRKDKGQVLSDELGL
jgi:hypothetical protein